MSTNQKLILKSDLDQIPLLEEFLIEVCETYEVNDDIFPDMMLAVTEATSNAIIHGNEFDPSKEVIISLDVNLPRLIFSIIDQGNGFNPDNLPSPVDDGNLLKSGGRGVYLMKHYAEDVSFNDKGNEVLITFNLNQD